jgi:hypothetical protein
MHFAKNKNCVNFRILVLLAQGKKIGILETLDLHFCVTRVLAGDEFGLDQFGWIE